MSTKTELIGVVLVGVTLAAGAAALAAGLDHRDWKRTSRWCGSLGLDAVSTSRDGWLCADEKGFVVLPPWRRRS